MTQQRRSGAPAAARCGWSPLEQCCTEVRSQVDVRGAACVVAAAFVANILESYVGATLQGKVAWLTNDVVNVAQITAAALLCMLLLSL